MFGAGSFRFGTRGMARGMGSTSQRGALFLTGRSDVAAAYSFRRVNPLYVGPLVRVRRSSDSAEQDFGGGQRVVNWPEILSFIDAGSGFVSKWYDQSANGHDLAQSTAAQQPAIGLLANGLPGMTFDGSNDNLITGAFARNQPHSFNAVFRKLTTTTSYIFDGLVVDTGGLESNATDPCFIYAGVALTSGAAPMPNQTRGAVGGCFNGVSGLLEVNAATVASFAGNVGSGNPSGITVGSGGGLTQPSNSEVQELVFFNAAHTSAQIKADNAAMRAAWRF